MSDQSAQPAGETTSVPPTQQPVGKKPLSEAQLKRNELARERARAYHAQKKADRIELEQLREKTKRLEAARAKRAAKKKDEEVKDDYDDLVTEMVDNKATIVHRRYEHDDGSVEDTREVVRRREQPAPPKPQLKRTITTKIQESESDSDGYIQRRSEKALRAAKALKKVEAQLHQLNSQRAGSQTSKYLSMLMA